MTLTGDPRWDQPCAYWVDGGYCGTMPSRRFLNGRRCQLHTPAAIAGHPEPGRTKYVLADLPPPQPVPVEPPPPVLNVDDLPPVERSKAAGASRQATKERIAQAKAKAREAAQAAASR